MTERTELFDKKNLLLGGNSAEYGIFLGASFQFLVRNVFAREVFFGIQNTDTAGNRGHGVCVVARDNLNGNALTLEVRNDLLRVGTDAVGNGYESNRSAILTERGMLCNYQHALALLGEYRDCLFHFLIDLTGYEMGRTDGIYLAVGKCHGGMLSLRGEGDFVRYGNGAILSVCLNKCARGRV